MTTLLLLFFVGTPLICALLTYTVYCYEESNQTGHPLHLLLPDVAITALKSFARETLILILHPLGLWPGLWARPSAGKPLVILVHGLFHNQSGWILFRHWLRAHGYAVACFSYPSWKTDLDSTENRLLHYLENIIKDYPGQPIHLVGHSLGGLLLRAVLGRVRASDRIKTLVTMGTPYRGSKLSPFALNSLGRFLKHEGETVRDLAARPFPEHVRLLALRVPVDNMVLPNSALRCDVPGCTEQTTRHASHLGMLFSRQIFNDVLLWIRQG